MEGAGGDTRTLDRAVVPAYGPHHSKVLHSKSFWIGLWKDTIRGASIGGGGYFLVQALSLLIKIRGSNAGKIGGKVVALLKDPALYQWAAFGGVYVGGFKGTLQLTQGENIEWRRYRGGVAGLIAGLAYFLGPRTSGRKGLMLLVLVRAIEVLFKSPRVTSRVPKFDHYDTALTCASSCVILSLWLNHPGSLSRGYEKFLGVHGHMTDLQVKNFTRFLGQGKTGFNVDELAAEDPIYLGMPRVGNPHEILAYFMHPHTRSFWVHFISFAIAGVRRAMPVYAPVYFVPLLLFRTGLLLKEPVGAVSRAVKDWLRSSLFLSLYCTFAWKFLESCYTVAGLHGPAGTFLAGVPAGLAVLVEKKPRRIELGLFILRQAIEGLWNYLVKHGVVKNVKHGDGLVFVLASAALGHALVSAPERLRLFYRKTLFGGLLGSDAKVNEEYAVPLDEASHHDRAK